MTFFKGTVFKSITSVLRSSPSWVQMFLFILKTLAFLWNPPDMITSKPRDAVSRTPQASQRAASPGISASGGRKDNIFPNCSPFYKWCKMQECQKWEQDIFSHQDVSKWPTIHKVRYSCLKSSRSISCCMQCPFLWRSYFHGRVAVQFVVKNQEIFVRPWCFFCLFGSVQTTLNPACRGATPT